MILVVAQFLRHPPRARRAGGVGRGDAPKLGQQALHDRRDAAHAAVLRAVRDVRDDGDRRSAGHGQRRADGQGRGAFPPPRSRCRDARSTRSPTAAAGSSGAGRRTASAARLAMGIAFVLQAVCLVLVLTVGRLSGTLFTVTLVAHLLHLGRDLLALPVARRRLLRHAVRHLELRRAVLGEGRGVDHRRRRRRRCCSSTSAAGPPASTAARCWRSSPPSRIRPSQLAWPTGASTRRASDREVIRRMSAPLDARLVAQELAAAYASRSRGGRTFRARSQLRSCQGLCRRGRAHPNARSRRTRNRRPQGRLREQSDVASAQAGHAGLGAHVRRHRALCDSRPCVAANRPDVLAKDRA